MAKKVKKKTEYNNNYSTNSDYKAKKKKEPRKKKYKAWQVVLYTFILLFFIGVITVCVAATAFFIYIASNAPVFDESELYRSEPSTVYDKNGDVIANIGTEDRKILTYDEIPEVLINAIIATEDSKFFQHNGIDLPRFLVASTKQILGGTGGGASTLTMQLSKNNYTSTEDEGWEGIKRKFTDIYLAVFKIEPSYSKQQILEFYVNSFFLGSGYGVEKTSQNFFGKSAKDLNLAEAAMIAGLYQAPGAYHPYNNPEAAELRRQKVLSLMYRHGYISEEELQIAQAMTIDKLLQEKTTNDIASGIIDTDNQWFFDMVVRDVIKKTGDSPYTKSMQIYTTLDPKVQKHVSDIMNGKTYKWENNKVQAGVAVVDINTGAIAAIGGGRNIKTAQGFNRAIDINRQIGSTAKPLYDYGPAFEYLNWNTGTILLDEPYTYSTGTAIHNFDGGYTGYNTVEYHLSQSRNIPALKTFQANDSKNIIRFVTNLGLTPDIYSCNSGYNLEGKKCVNKNDANDVVDAKQSTTLRESHAIGGYNGENPLSMATAYSAFGNGGYYNEPYSFTKIVYPDTGETYVNKTETKQVMQDSTAYMITYILQKAAQSYRSVNGIKYAGKTGTSNFDDNAKKKYKLPSSAINDLWLVGYNTEYTIAVWYGYDNIQEGYHRFGNSNHQKLFQALAKGIFKSKDDFQQPSSVVKVTTESDSSGLLLPSDNTPSSYKRTSLFISGTEPNKVSTRFKTLDDVTNLTANDNGDGTATISWSGIGVPDALNTNYLTGIYKLASSFRGNDATSYANYVLKKNKSLFGEVGYNVYVQKSDGSLELKKWTSGTSYTLEDSNGNYKIVVKACYSKYNNNMSKGKSVNVTISGSTITPPSVTGPTDQNNNY